MVKWMPVSPEDPMAEPPIDPHHHRPDARDWDRRYQARQAPGEPARVLSLHRHLLPRAGLALDLACGLGANALLLAGAGLATLAWDYSPLAIQRLDTLARERQLDIRAQVRDVVAEPPEPGRFAVITVSRFLERSLAPALMAALAPGGLLFYETFVRDRVAAMGPDNPDFLLRENELLQLFGDLRLRVYREEGSVGDVSRGIRNVAMLVAQRGE